MHQREIRSVVVLAVLAVAAPAATRAQKMLTPEMVVELERVTSVAIDRAGARVAFVLEVPRTAKEKPGPPWSEVWVVPAAGGAARRYSVAQQVATAPAFTPDGRRLLFLSKPDLEEDDDEKAQIHAVDVDGGAPVALTEHETSILDFRIAPDGERIAFVAADPKTEEEKKARETGRDWKVHDASFKHRRLYVVPAAGGRGERILDREWSLWDFEWTPDSTTIVVQTTDVPRTDESFMFRRISAVDLGRRKETIAIATLGKLGPMEVSPDGSTLAFLGASTLNDPLAQTVFLAALDGGEARRLLADQRASAIDLEWLDERTLLVLVLEGVGTRLIVLDIQTGTRTVLGESAEIVHRIEAVPGAGRLAAVAETPSHPAEAYVADLPAPGARDATRPWRLDRLTRHNGELDGVRLARQEVFRWSAAEGWPLEGILTFPLDYQEGRRYPLVLQIHGGPEGADLHGWTTSPIYPVQLLAQDGYFVLQPNYRGSGGLGIAFSKADHDDLGGAEYDDVLRAVDALVEGGRVDGERVGTGGFSYGGYFSAWGATRHSDRFRAAVVGAGISNWISFTGTTDIPYEMSLVHWDSWWFDQPELHWERSPLAHIERAKTPTLILHGAADERVHPEQSLELYTALRIKQVPTQYVLYPREPHGIRERAHRLDAIERIRGWFAKHLAGD